MFQIIKISGCASLCAIWAVSANAQDITTKKPPTFDTCLQAETSATMSGIYAACMRSVQTSDFSRYVIDAKLKAKIKSTGVKPDKLQAEATTERNPHYYYAAIALARQVELLLKLEKTQGLAEHSAKLCWHAEKAARLSYYYKGEMRGHSFEDRQTRMVKLREQCQALPRRNFDASKSIPDSGDLMADIPEYKTCLSSVTSENIFDIYYACHLADRKNDMLAFRKAGGGVRGPMSGGISLSDVKIATAKIKFRQAEIANVMEPKNMEYMCNLIDRVVFNFGQSNKILAAESKDAAMLKQAKQMQAGCKQRNF